MIVYVAEIKGRGIAAFNATETAKAEHFVCDRTFLDDLMVLRTGGLPLWDGVSKIYIRQAFPQEEAKWQASHSKAIRHGNIEADDEEMWLTFLVSLTKPDRRHDEK